MPQQPGENEKSVYGRRSPERSRLEKVIKRIAYNQPKVAAARAQLEHWITDKAKDALFQNEEIPEDRIRKLRRSAKAD